MNRNVDGLPHSFSPAAASQTSGSYSLAETLNRKSLDRPTGDLKKVRPGSTIDLSKKVGNGTQDLAQPQSYNLDLKARIEALEKAENKTKLICPGCGATSVENRLTCGACGRYFEQGIEETIWDKALKPIAADRKVLSPAEQEKAAQMRYLGRRLGAKAVDTVIVASLVFVETVSYLGLIKAMLAVPFPAAAQLLINFFWIVNSLIIGSIILGYQAIFECSPVQATLGKLLFGLHTTDCDGHNARFERLVFKTILLLLPMIGFACEYAYFWEARLRHGLWLDAASTAVVAVSAVAAVITNAAMSIMMGKDKRRQTVVDIVAGTMVRERD